jgi:hypothetical protein
MWNQTFDLPYHVFRQRVRRIAELNLQRVENAVRARWDEIPDGALVAPVDDDDWFAPDSAQRWSASSAPARRAATGPAASSRSRSACRTGWGCCASASSRRPRPSTPAPPTTTRW